MTHNQIAYQNYLEARRSNIAREGETSQHNRVMESLESSKLAEMMRSNLASESIKQDQNLVSWAQVGETHRANVQRETETTRSNLAKELETQRSNLAKEQENTRSNLAKEQETKRHNLNVEGLSAASTQASTARDYSTAFKNYTSGIPALSGLAKSILLN